MTTKMVENTQTLHGKQKIRNNVIGNMLKKKKTLRLEYLESVQLRTNSSGFPSPFLASDDLSSFCCDNNVRAATVAL